MPQTLSIRVTFPKKANTLVALETLPKMIEEGIKGQVSPLVEAIFAESQIQVPQYTKELKKSGKVYPFKKDGKRLRAAITYGDSSVKYAVIQHETPPGVSGAGGLRYNHSPPTKWKYLEDPARSRKKYLKKSLKRAGSTGLGLAMAGAGFRKVLNVWR